MNSRQKRDLKRLLKHRGFTPEQIEAEINKRTTGTSSECSKELSPKRRQKNARRRYAQNK